MCLPKFHTSEKTEMQVSGCVTVRTFVDGNFTGKPIPGGILISVAGKDPHAIQFVDRSIETGNDTFIDTINYSLSGDSNAITKTLSKPKSRFRYIDVPNDAKPCPYYDCDSKGEVGRRPVKRVPDRLSMFDKPSSSLALLGGDIQNEVGIFIAKTFCIAEGKTQKIVSWKILHKKVHGKLELTYLVSIKDATKEAVAKYREKLTFHGFDPNYLPDPA